MDIVVARYKEDLGWLGDLCDKAVIYNKGPLDDAVEAGWKAKGARVVYLENVGRESHTYLRHIIDNYDGGLAEWTVFTQGNPFDHCKDVRGMLVNCPKESGRSPNWTPSGPNWSYMHEHFRIRSWAGKLNEPFPGDFRAFWDMHVRVPYPADKVVRVYWGGIFAVSRSRILQRPKADYEAMLKTVMSPNPEAGHFFERAWYYLFE